MPSSSRSNLFSVDGEIPIRRAVSRTDKPFTLR
jgi:hypothetical protein